MPGNIELQQIYTLFEERLQNPDSYTKIYTDQEPGVYQVQRAGYELDEPGLITHGLLDMGQVVDVGQVCIPWLVDPSDDRGDARLGRHSFLVNEYKRHPLITEAGLSPNGLLGARKAPISWMMYAWRHTEGFVAWHDDISEHMADFGLFEIVAEMTGRLAAFSVVYEHVPTNTLVNVSGGAINLIPDESHAHRTG